MSEDNRSSSVRAQVFEVIVQQALENTDWEAICSGPMLVNKITVEEVKAEVQRRTMLTESRPAQPTNTPNIMDKSESEVPISGTSNLLVVIVLLLLLVILVLSVAKWIHSM